MHWDAERQERKLCLHHPLPPLHLRHHHPAIQGAVPLSEVFLGNASRDFSVPLPASVMKSLCSSFSLSFNQILILFLLPGKHMNNEVIIIVINASSLPALLYLIFYTVVIIEIRHKREGLNVLY